MSWSRIESRVQSKIHQDLHVDTCSRNGARCCSQTCERRFGRAAGSKRTLSISLRCRSASVLTVARKSTPVACHWNLAKQVRDSRRKPNRCQISAGGLCQCRHPFVWLTAADAAWANRPGGSSTSGHVIIAAYPNIFRCESSTVSVLAWNSLGAECAAFSTSL